MKDLRIYYKDKKGINEEFDKDVEKLANKFGLRFEGSGIELGKMIRDIHYRLCPTKEKK